MLSKAEKRKKEIKKIEKTSPCLNAPITLWKKIKFQTGVFVFEK